MDKRNDTASRTPRLHGRSFGVHLAQVVAALAVCLLIGGWAQQQAGNADHTAPEPGAAQQQVQPAPAAKVSGQAQAADPKSKMADDAARLLQMATELKTEVNKTNKDTLSLKVIRQAESIERLAKGVRQQLKQTGGAS